MIHNEQAMILILKEDIHKKTFGKLFSEILQNKIISDIKQSNILQSKFILNQSNI